MGKYSDNQRFNLMDGTTLVIDCLYLQTLYCEPGADMDQYTYYNYHIEDAMGNTLRSDYSAPQSAIDDILRKLQSI